MKVGKTWFWIGEDYRVTGNTDNGAQAAFDWWMNRMPQCDNLLDPNYTQTGAGFVYEAGSDCGGDFVVAFTRPR